MRLLWFSEVCDTYGESWHRKAALYLDEVNKLKIRNTLTSLDSSISTSDSPVTLSSSEGSMSSTSSLCCDGHLRISVLTTPLWCLFEGHTQGTQEYPGRNLKGFSSPAENTNRLDQTHGIFLQNEATAGFMLPNLHCSWDIINTCCKREIWKTFL